MKKIFFWGLAALPLLTMLAVSCGRETVESKKDRDNLITFNSAVGRQTLSRATELALTDLKSGAGFNVYGYATGTATSLATFDLSWGGTAWGYTTAVQKPTGNFDYFAYYPSTGVSSYANAAGTATFDYEVQPTYSAQVDLLAAALLNVATANVTLTFNHILSQVNFAIQGITNVEISVSNIKVNGVKDEGTYTFNTGSWSTTAQTADYAYAPVGAVSGVVTTDGTNSILYLGNTGNIGGAINDRDNALMLMPQGFGAANGGNFSFSYELKDASDATLKSGSATAYFGDFASSLWSPGKRYLYLIDFSNLLINDIITFEVEVAPWADAESTVTAKTLYVAEVNKEAIESAIDDHNTNRGSKTVFPISLPTAPIANITLQDFDDNNFAVGDKIYIYCGSPAGAAFIKLHTSKSTPGASGETHWTVTVDGSDAVLEKVSVP